MKISKLVGKLDAYIWLTELANKKITYMTDLSKDEIGALCLVEKFKSEKENDLTIEYRVSDVFIVEQQVNGGTCELSPQGIAKLYATLGKQADNLLCWYHSHHNMSPSPSGQDNEMLKVLAEATETFYIRLIGNKKGEFSTLVVDKEENLRLEDIPVYIAEEQDKIKDFIKEEIDKKVTAKTYTSSVVKTGTKKTDSVKTNKTTQTELSLSVTEEEIRQYCRDFKVSSYGNYGYWRNGTWVRTADSTYDIGEHCLGLLMSRTYTLNENVEIEKAKYNIKEEIINFLEQWGYFI